jgi:hypothetical protein
MECKGSIELWFDWFVPKLGQDSGKLGVHFLTINSVEFGGSLGYGNVRGSLSMDKKSGLGDKLISVID